MDKFLLVMVIALITLIGLLTQGVISTEDTIIEGEVIDVIFYEKYMTVWFDNNDSYNIQYNQGDYSNVIDLTVNSNMRIKLQKSDPWMQPNTDNIWAIKSIVKVPDNLTKG